MYPDYFVLFVVETMKAPRVNVVQLNGIATGHIIIMGQASLDSEWL